jgi:hypothetical protein
MKRNISLLFVVLILASGCSIYHVNSEETATEFYPSKASPNDVVYLESITDPYEVIGYVTVNTERNQRMSDVIAKMKREAAILGADAITNIKGNATGQWKKLPAQEMIGNGYVRANFTATMVVLK